MSDKLFCPYCGLKARILTSEEEQGVNDEHILCYCKKCDTSFIVRSGNIVDEWAQEAKEMLDREGG